MLSSSCAACIRSLLIQDLKSGYHPRIDIFSVSKYVLHSGTRLFSARIKENDRHHQILTRQRGEVLKQHEVDLESNLKLNKELASKYRKLQNDYFVLKNEMLQHFSNRVQTESSIKDLKKVSNIFFHILFKTLH